VLQQNSHALTGVLILASLSAVAATPAIAEPTQERVNNQPSETLISQALGHDTYEEGGEQMSFSDYILGRVRGRTGNYLSVELMNMEGTEVKAGEGRVIMEGSANPGDNVLLTEEDGEYEFVGVAHPAWITELQEDYKWNMSAEMKGTPLKERTASLWQTLAQNEGRTATTAPVETEPQPETGEEYPSEPAEEYPSEPVRGMW
jgi:hypothetical protein